jgi:hypothetical protein
MARSEVKEIQIITLFIACHHAYGEPTVTEPDKCPAVEWVRHPRSRQLFAPVEEWIRLGRHL